MHELSICRALLDQVGTVAREHRARGVSTIHVRVGPLSGVVPELLAQAFTLARADTVAESAELRIAAAPLRVRCEACGAESEATPNRLLCARCGDWHTELLSGDELLLESVELTTDEDDSDTDAVRIPCPDPRP